MNNRTRNPLAPLVISDTNLSHAWGRVLWHVVKNSGDYVLDKRKFGNIYERTGRRYD